MANRLIALDERQFSNDNYEPVHIYNTGVDNKVSDEKIELSELNNTKIDIDTIKDKDKEFGRKDVGINSPTSSAFLRLKENGDVNISSNASTEINLNHETGTISLFGKCINLQANDVNIKCDDLGLKINNFVLNPFIYKMCLNDLNKNEYRDLMLEATVRRWNDGTAEGGWMRDNISFKPFYPIKTIDEEKEMDELIGWSL